MNLSEFDYFLPEELIAQSAVEPRDHSKLLKINPNTQKIEEKKFFEILNDLGENDVLILNKTKVINARLNGFIENDKNKICEIFLHKQLNKNTWDCLVYPGRKLKLGKKIFFNVNDENILQAEIKEISDSGRIVEFSKGGIEFLELIEKIGTIPLPPYIKQKLNDGDRYQTVFNEVSGSVAAPTAGLHFTKELLEKLKEKGVKIEKVLLHVGLGTFKNVETENILEHKMHSEYIELDEQTAKNLNKYKKSGKRIISVGTTSIRVLESFANEFGELESGKKDTNIFIYPGYNWKFVDAMITNFHLPKSTLLMLVSSFAGKDFITKAYNYAIENKFRFFSFGDAMFIEERKK
ncbi:tRNA preQ1(34) S-adenosylmethionine ribosyltransferase-isomerase QueA [Candidatus Gracilibacteria bacterium GN02-872]|nr:tRNA preQ1(34) S-adenosylmethionine ribosyltransferase-isomerase QueA [Candidatus Gracilibacteria bacterium GN02-872]